MNETTATITAQTGTGTNRDPLATEIHLDPDKSADSGGSGEEGYDKTKGRPAGDPYPKTELTLQQQQLLGALIVDPNIQAACKGVGVGRTTAHRWLQDPVFRDELVRQRDAVLSESMDSVKTHAAKAMTELAEMLNSKDERLRRLVCNDILGHAMKVRELQDIEGRLAALEKALKAQNKGRKQ